MRANKESDNLGKVQVYQSPTDEMTSMMANEGIELMKGIGEIVRHFDARPNIYGFAWVEMFGQRKDRLRSNTPHFFRVRVVWLPKLCIALHSMTPILVSNELIPSALTKPDLIRL